MRFFVDGEFMEDGVVILPLSLAAVTETGEAFYAVFTDADRSQANEFVIEQVLPYVDAIPEELSQQFVSLIECYGTREEVRDAFFNWVESFRDEHGGPEFWASHASYDWIMICQLFGKMVDLPDGWPMRINDIQQFRAGRYIPIPGPTFPHHSLSDADNVKEKHEYLAHLLGRSM